MSLISYDRFNKLKADLKKKVQSQIDMRKRKRFFQKKITENCPIFNRNHCMRELQKLNVALPLNSEKIRMLQDLVDSKRQLNREAIKLKRFKQETFSVLESAIDHSDYYHSKLLEAYAELSNSEYYFEQLKSAKESDYASVSQGIRKFLSEKL